MNDDRIGLKWTEMASVEANLNLKNWNSSTPVRIFRQIWFRLDGIWAQLVGNGILLEFNPKLFKWWAKFGWKWADFRRDFENRVKWRQKLVFNLTEIGQKKWRIPKNSIAAKNPLQNFQFHQIINQNSIKKKKLDRKLSQFCQIIGRKFDQNVAKSNPILPKIQLKAEPIQPNNWAKIWPKNGAKSYPIKSWVDFSK